MSLKFKSEEEWQKFKKVHGLKEVGESGNEIKPTSHKENSILAIVLFSMMVFVAACLYVMAFVL